MLLHLMASPGVSEKEKTNHNDLWSPFPFKTILLLKTRRTHSLWVEKLCLCSPENLTNGQTMMEWQLDKMEGNPYGVKKYLRPIKKCFIQLVWTIITSKAKAWLALLFPQTPSHWPLTTSFPLWGFLPGIWPDFPWIKKHYLLRPADPTDGPEPCIV